MNNNRFYVLINTQDEGYEVSDHGTIEEAIEQVNERQGIDVISSTIIEGEEVERDD